MKPKPQLRKDITGEYAAEVSIAQFEAEYARLTGGLGAVPEVKAEKVEPFDKVMAVKEEVEAKKKAPARANSRPCQ